MINSQRLELTLTRKKFRGSKDVQAIEVWLYAHTQLLKFTLNQGLHQLLNFTEFIKSRPSPITELYWIYWIKAFTNYWTLLNVLNHGPHLLPNLTELT